MIQRIQSLYLLLLAIFSVIGLFFLPFYEFSLIIFSTAVLLKVYIAQSIAFSIFFLVTFQKKEGSIVDQQNTNGHSAFIYNIFDLCLGEWAHHRYAPDLACVAPPGNCFSFLANKGISKDEDLIRSVDRLR